MSRTQTINCARFSSSPTISVDNIAAGTGHASVSYVVGSYDGATMTVYNNAGLNISASIPVAATDTLPGRLQALVGQIASQESLTLGANASGPDHVLDTAGNVLA